MDTAPLAGPVGKLRDELDTFDRAYSAGHHGLWSGERRADMVDTALRSLFETALPPGAIGLAAVGGYGRREQLPRSDIDVLIVHDGSAADEVAALAERMFYPLWDGGFELGQAVRTPAECERIARERLDALTSMLDMRPIAGASDLVEHAAERVRSVAEADMRAFARSLLEDARAREARFGATVHLLEPDLKHGAGGLRDAQAVRWVARSSGARLVRASERSELETAVDFLTRVRSALHLETGKRVDRLPLELQPAIARAMGFSDEPRLIAEDGLMRAVFENARTVHWIAGNVLARADEGTRMPADEAAPFGDLDEALEALAAIAAAGGRPDPGLLDAVEATSVVAEITWNDRTRDAFMRIVRSGAPGVAVLDALDRLDLLGRLLPAWNDVRCRPQRDPYHRFTVDTHLTSALAEMSRLLGGGEAAGGLHVAQPSPGDHDGLLLGALLHDIGKTGEGSHVPVGARVAASTLDHMGVNGRPRELAEFMVAEHLLLPDTATRRDLTDENLILGVAARIGSSERLAALALLAMADAAATGPAAQTPWRMTLLRELVTRVQRIYDRGHMGIELAQQLTDRVDAVRELLGDEPEPVVERFVLDMPRGYFLAIEPRRIAGHFPTIAPPVGSNEVRTAAMSGAQPGTYELLVVAADRPGLLSWIAGAVSLAGLSILTAQVFTTDDGVAVDVFEVEGVYEAEVGEPRWREFRSVLRKAVEGRISLEHRVADKRARYPAPRSTVEVTVTVDNDASDYSTVIEVGAPDRIGLLYDITRALADLTLDVHLAKVSTYADRVVDAFYVRDAVGAKIIDPAQVSEIAALVRARLEV
jgi:[protein-PII] uridylyltransferase